MNDYRPVPEKPGVANQSVAEDKPIVGDESIVGDKPVVGDEPVIGGNSVGRTIPHDSAVGHVTGAAPYIDDLPCRVDELYVGFVGSPVASGKVVSLETSKAAALDGVAAVFTYTDVGDHNVFGPLFCDEPFLAGEEVLYVGQPVVLIAAESEGVLAEAKKLVEINVEETSPVLELDDAIRGEHFIGPQRQIARGDAANAISGCDSPAVRRVPQWWTGAVLSRIAGGDRFSGRARPVGRSLVDPEHDRNPSHGRRSFRFANASSRLYLQTDGRSLWR